MVYSCMRNTKILETSVDLFDPNEIYQSDMDALLLRKLNRRYQNRCFQGSFILKVARIIKRSAIRMVTDRSDGGATIDVQFLADTLILVEGEVLHNCKIIEIHDNGIIAENTYANIKIQRTNTNLFKILKKNQFIPIIVHKVRYIPNKTKISLIGEPFRPRAKDTMFYTITEPLSPEQTENVAKLRDEVDAELEKHKDLMKLKPYRFFKNLLYPFKTNQKFEVSNVVKSLQLKKKSLTLEELTSIKSGVVVYPDEHPKDSGEFFVSNKEYTNADNSLSAPMYIIAMGMLNSYLLYLQALRGFVETYKTPDDILTLKTYWQICTTLKQ